MKNIDERELERRIRQILLDAGILPGEGLDCSGEIVACGTTKKPQSKDGRYQAHLDWPPNLGFANYHEGGEWQTVSLYKPGEMASFSDEERQELAETIKQQRASAIAAKKERQERTAEKARKKFERFPHAGNNAPYLVNKKIEPVGDIRQTADGRLLIPVQDKSLAITSLQIISTTGEKTFLPNGKVASCFFPIPAKDRAHAGPLLICEGYATGASLNLATGFETIVAFSAHNLSPVAGIFRGEYPERKICICADYDKPNKTYPEPGGTGVALAKRTARAIGAFLAICPAINGEKADFNDLWAQYGPDKVRDVILSAISDSAQITQDELPKGFEYRNGKNPGLWHFTIKHDGKINQVYIGPKLEVLGKSRTERGDCWGLLLRWHDPDGNLHTWAMDRGLLGGKDNSEVIQALFNRGWEGAIDREAKNLLVRFLGEYQTNKRVLCVTSTGWHNGAYVLPDNVISGPDYSEMIALQTEIAKNPYITQGTHEAWKETIGKWSAGNSRLVFAISAAFASVLLEPTGLESGGFNFIGASSIGKSTGLYLAASVWGSGKYPGGYVGNWNTTINGLEAYAALHSDSLLCLDEIGQAPAKAINEASYLLGNGTGRQRAKRDGGYRAAQNWRVMILSSGEVGLQQKIREAGGSIRAGQLVRLLDIPADAGVGMGVFEDLHGFDSPGAFSDAMKQAASEYYGHAARLFIDNFLSRRMECLEVIKDSLFAGASDFAPIEAGEQVRRAEKRFLLCAIAGEMAAEWGLVPWKPGHAKQAAKTCFDAWLEVRGGYGNADDMLIVQRVHAYIEAHGNSRFQDVARPNDTCFERVGFRQILDNGTEYMFLPEMFQKEICAGIMDATQAAKVLYDNNLLIRGEGNHMTKRPTCDLPGMGRKRCYTIFIPRCE